LAGAAAVVIGATSVTVASWIVVRPDLWSVVKGLARPALPLLRRALPLGIAFIAISIYYNVDIVLLGLLRPTTDVGYYAVAYRPVLALLTVAFAVASVATPVLSRLHADAPERLPSLLRTLSLGLLALAFPAAVGGTIAGAPVIVTAFGEEYRAAALPFAILVWSCVAVFANAPFSCLLIAEGRDRWYLGASAAGAVINVLANLIFIPIGGPAGSATATLIAHAVVLIIVIFPLREAAIPPIAFAVRRLIIPTAVMGAAIWPIRDSMIAVPVGLVVYGAALLAVGGVPLLGRWSEQRSVPGQ
jgi:O-antigen/teichoic acid export membrane protein